MRRNILLIAVALAAILGMTLLLDRGSTPSAPVEPVSTHKEIKDLPSQPAPDFTFKTIDKDVNRSLSEFRGKTVLLNFWASWCSPCIIEFPKLEKIADTNQDTLVVLAVSIDTETEDLHRFLTKVKFKPRDNFLLTQDFDKSISQDLFQTIRVPETIIINPDGKMVRKIAGDTDWLGPEMTEFLSTLAAPRSIP